MCVCVGACLWCIWNVMFDYLANSLFGYSLNCALKGHGDACSDSTAGRKKRNPFVQQQSWDKPSHLRQPLQYIDIRDIFPAQSEADPSQVPAECASVCVCVFVCVCSDWLKRKWKWSEVYVFYLSLLEAKSHTQILSTCTFLLLLWIKENAWSPSALYM